MTTQFLPHHKVRPAAAAVAHSAQSPSPPIANRTTGALVPQTGAYLGATAGTTDTTQQGRIASVVALENDMGRQLGIVHVYHKWTDPFPSKSDEYFLHRGSTLMLSWAGTDTRLIASGEEDSTIRRQAASIKAVKAPVLLEWRWEMDRPNLRAETWSGPDYVRAWKRIQDLFSNEGVTNAVWVWCPTAAGFADGRAQAFYPGDNRVDWICADAYADSTLKPLADILAPFLTWAHDHPKPIMIGEFGAEEQAPGQRAEWLTAAGGLVRRDPQIKALVYFDVNSLEHNHLFRWRLDSSPTSLAAFVALGRDPSFQAGT